MSSIEYHLFRVKFVKPSQLSIFRSQITPQDMFLASVESRPSVAARQGYIWHVGNLRMFSSTSGYFAVGRTTSSTIEKFDMESGNFIEEELEESPHTHCVFDASIGIVGIARKTQLSPTTKGIARRLEQLFASTRTVVENDVLVEVRPIPDPDGFLRVINRAYRVLRFTASFRGPNPFDADEHFQKPLSVYASAAGAEKGKATLTGTDLDREVLTEVTRSTAATGNDASARVQKTKYQVPVTVALEGNPVKQS